MGGVCIMGMFVNIKEIIHKMVSVVSRIYKMFKNKIYPLILIMALMTIMSVGKDGGEDDGNCV